MQSNRLGRDLAILFSVVLLLYLAAFQGVQHMRERKGAWRITFERNAAGKPVFVVTQPALHVSRFQITFPEEQPPATNFTATLTLDTPRQPPFDVPFGRVIYEDLTIKPGAVTFDLFGHEVELLPRTLIVNRQEIAWQKETNLTLWTTNKVKTIRVPNSK